MPTITEPTEGQIEVRFDGGTDPALGVRHANGSRTWPEVDILGHGYDREGACTRAILDGSRFVVIPPRLDHKLTIIEETAGQQSFFNNQE